MRYLLNANIDNVSSMFQGATFNIYRIMIFFILLIKIVNTDTHSKNTPQDKTNTFLVSLGT